ncbi:MAG TPA: putative sporulation protein YtxC [Bacillus sp. (in: firmicutes)]|uniref:putative sporulation protein YtxC n=1 Tax=Bacillus litorisediminis TaxID=2922713 RepID=UPI001FABF1F8|nr:putative sporulation protein YtxC [Bacillus litorisediminis]HWO75519.1 putative sporulation protein YtxC [Bacillus sp. (in: firmicutes)]
MFQVHFEETEEAKELLRSLTKTMSSSLFIEGIEILHNDRTVSIRYPNEVYEDCLHLLQNSLKDFIIGYKKEKWFEKLLEQQYYYDEAEERHQILSILHSILEGEREDLELLPYIDEEEILEGILEEFLREQSSFFFESFETFRLKPYFEHLMNYLDVAIDEYKMEQEYQAFVHMLRDFLKGRESRYKKIFLVDYDGFQFFSEDGRQLKRTELAKIIDRKLVTNHPIYVDSVTIAPLISIAPEEVHVFTDNMEQGMVVTLKNIFEEKLTIYPLKSYPFQEQVKH